MRNKNLLLRLWLIAMAVGGFGLSFNSAAATIFNLNFDSAKFTAASTKSITDKMMYVHFADNGNNFGGFLYFSNGSWDVEENPDQELFNVVANHDLYQCRTKLKWFYYNAERWERLWPLDNETRANVPANQELEIQWWIYANCINSGYIEALEHCPEPGTEGYAECEARVKDENAALGFWYYGSLDQTYEWNKFNLTVWVKYKTDNGAGRFISIDSDSKLAPTFQNLDNIIPVWFVYDYNGWVGLAWCRFSDGVLDSNSMKKLIDESGGDPSIIFMYDRNEKKVKYRHTRLWHKFNSGDIICEPMSMADTLLRIIVEWVVWMGEGGNEWNTKFWSVGNTSDTKMQYFGTKTVSNATLKNYAIKKAELLCRWKWEENPSNVGTIICSKNWFTNPVNLDWIAWKTLIVKNWNVTVTPFKDNEDTRNYDIYLLNWDLIIDESDVENGSGIFVFNTGGFISDKSVDDFSGEVHNALCSRASCNWAYVWNEAAVWSFIRWNFIVNGNVKWKDGDLKNKYFIYWKFTTNDTFTMLEKTFSWICENWLGSDGNYCPETRDNWYNPYRNAALVVIDQNYESPLLR